MHNAECSPSQKIDIKLIEAFEDEKGGHCSAFIARFFDGLAIEKRLEFKSTRDDFTHLKKLVDKIITWDEKTPFPSKDKKELITLAYQLATFQDPQEILPIGQNDFDLFLIDTEGRPILKKEFSIVGDFRNRKSIC